jgi:hypothetical protein
LHWFLPVPFTHHYIADATKIIKGKAITLHNEISHTDLQTTDQNDNTILD